MSVSEVFELRGPDGVTLGAGRVQYSRRPDGVIIGNLTVLNKLGNEIGQLEFGSSGVRLQVKRSFSVGGYDEYAITRSRDEHDMLITMGDDAFMDKLAAKAGFIMALREDKKPLMEAEIRRMIVNAVRQGGGKMLETENFAESSRRGDKGDLAR